MDCTSKRQVIESKPAAFLMLANPRIFPMKVLLGLALGIMVGASCVCEAQNIASQSAQTTVPEPTPYAITVQDGNSRVWESTVYETGPSGQVVPRKHSYTEMASGLNHWVNGQWVESKEWIDILPNGTAVATNGQHQAYFPGDIYQGQIKLVTPDGLQLNSRPMGLSYFDGTNSVLIAELTNSVGVVVGNNQVVYPNAFTDFKVDLRYTYTKAGFEQDIILRQQPPTPESLGLNPDATRLQVLTEFFSPPQPTIQTTQLPVQAGLSLSDQSLGFGTMQMVPGKAFLLGTNAVNPKARVSKHWLLLNGRQFLVEEVPVDAILDGLASLPLTAMNSGSSKHSLIASKHMKLPHQRLAQNNSKTMLMAKAELPAQGFVLDYQTVSGNLTNVTLNGDATYYISGNANLFGTTTIEGGTVVKYANPGPTVLITGSVNCNTSAYRPAVFTSLNDNTIGESISGSTGTPSVDHSVNCYYLYFDAISQVNLQDLRFKYAYCSLTVQDGNLNLSDTQFIHNDYPIYLVNVGQAKVYNVLMADVEVVAFEGFSAAFNVKHLTFDQGVQLGENDYRTTIALTNCLLTGVSSLGNIPYTTNYFTALSTNLGVFQTAGGGNYYLSTNSPYRNAGTTNIDATLLADIKTKTTYPPILYSNVSFSTNIVWNPQSQRDTDTPDLGYHYDPIDFVVGGCDLSTNLTVTNGAVVGWFENQGAQSSSGQGYGISLNNGANLTLQGTATVPCWMVRYDTAQEGSLGTRGWMGGVMINGSGSGLPQLNSRFSKWAVAAADAGPIRDNWARGTSSFVDSEFYVGAFQAYDQSSVVMTNNLIFRFGFYVFGYSQPVIPNVTVQNCLFYDGMFSLNRYAGQPTTVWIIKDNAFDGTGFFLWDPLVGNTNYANMDYNAYNTNNQSGLSYSYSPSPTNRLEIIGAHDVFTGNYNWQSSWLGNYYQPTNSLLINAGNVTADQLGLYHFTTQTNQVKETNSIVDIGYHYVATDGNGNPVDSNGNGIPDYLEDFLGNGQPLTISLIAPANNSYYKEPATISMQATVFDWSSVVTNVNFSRSAVQITGITNVPYQYTWPVVAARIVFGNGSRI